MGFSTKFQNLIATHLSVQVSTSEPESSEAPADEASPASSAPLAVTTNPQVKEKVNTITAFEAQLVLGTTKYCTFLHSNCSKLKVISF